MGFFCSVLVFLKLKDITKKRENQIPLPNRLLSLICWYHYWGEGCFEPISLLLYFCIPIHVTISLYSLLRVRMEVFESVDELFSPTEIRHSDLLTKCTLDLSAFALCPSVERVMLK